MVERDLLHTRLAGEDQELAFRRVRYRARATWKARPGMDPLFDCSPTLSIDPRQVAQRIMDIRSALAEEFIEDLKGVQDDNLQLLRDCLTINLANLEAPESEGGTGPETGDEGSG